jgi:hypothetical protein
MMRSVSFSAFINSTSVKNGKTEELKIDLRAPGTEGVSASIRLLESFHNGEELTVTIAPKQLDMERDTEQDGA